MHYNMSLFARLILSLLGILGYSAIYAQQNKAYPPSPFPDRVILGFKGDPAHSQAVSWRTDSTVTSSMAAIHEADPSPDFPKKAQILNAMSQKVKLDGREMVFHEVNFTNLKPATQYVYRVGNGSAWSEWFHFTTASDKSEPVSILYFGDAQNDIRSMWSRAIRGAYSKMPKANLIIHAGDLVNHSYTDAEWGEWFEAGGWINGMIANLPSPGNHEYVSDRTEIRKLSSHWRPQFSLPENGPEGLTETVYYIDYQGIRFISFDTEAGLQDSTAMRKELIWLEKVLKDNPNRWTVVTHHHPVLSTNSSQKRPGDYWRTELAALYKKYKVDIALQGHEHTYGRGVNIPIGQNRKNPEGPVYVVSVSGPKMSGVILQDWMDRAAINVQLYQTITISRDKLSYQAFTVNGELYDAFDLHKNKKGANRLVDLSKSIKTPERLEIPEAMRKGLKEEQIKAYNERFKAYKKRKGLE
jgi:3',5'-cyclic AMP phosphodiesterase CpdA